MADSREIVGWFYKNGRRIPIRKKSGMEKKDVVFSYGDNTGRRHAKVVDALPEKTNRFSNGYGKVGTTERDGKEYDVFSDRDRSDAFGYYAKPTKKEADAKLRKNAKDLGRTRALKGKESIRLRGSQEYSKKEWDAFSNKTRKSIIEKESRRLKKKSIRDLERREPE